MTTPTPADALDNRVYRIVERAANMGGCSQTHHEHLAIDAAKVVAALSPQPEVSVTQSDPIETFSHPYRPPVAIDGHLFTHTSDCDWPAALAEPPVTPDLRAALHRAFDDEFGTDRDQAYGADEVHDLIDRALASPDPEAGS